MSDFTEQEVSATSPQELSPDTPTVSDSLRGIETLAQYNARRTAEVLEPYKEETPFDL